MAPAISEALRLTGQPGLPALEALLDALAPQDLLIVLDNCEDLIGGCQDRGGDRAALHAGAPGGHQPGAAAVAAGTGGDEPQPTTTTVTALTTSGYTAPARFATWPKNMTGDREIRNRLMTTLPTKPRYL